MSSLQTIPSYPSTASAGREPKAHGPEEKLALVIPSFREAENLRVVLARVRAVLADLDIEFEILVVDDDSRDGTREIVSAIAGEDARVRLLVRTGERGLAGAILHGWRHTDAGILGAMDADGQHPAEVVPELVAAIRGGRDVAIGSRYASGSSRGRWNPMRSFVSAAGIWAARPLLPRVTDPLSGLFVVRRSCVENVFFQPTGFKLLLEILVRARIRSVEEVPISFARRRAGRSKAGFRVACDYLALLARLYGARLRMAQVPESSAGD